MSKKFLKTSMIVCSSVMLCLTVYQTNAYSMMTDAELQQCVKRCTVQDPAYGHHPESIYSMRGINAKIIGMKCPECDSLKQRIAKHNEALSKKNNKYQEDKIARLKIELLKDQINNAKK